ncbi:MAG: hypothetical protein ABWX68_07105 [Arthrobacter sp.]|uniref:hypothetical protein n=1 Tax=Arthrobacter sp. TaxID=1667 RepID=UPI00348B2776
MRSGESWRRSTSRREGPGSGSGKQSGPLAAYLILAALSASLIHAVFSFFPGWYEYMPFLPVPSLADLLAR